MNTKFVSLFLALVVLLSACGSSESIDAANGIELEPGDATGTLAIQLEQTEGLFIEGFEIGIRIENAANEVVYSGLWSDFVANSSTDVTFSDYYDSVFTQELAAGDYTVHSTMTVGIGPPPETPDLTGEMACTLPVTVSDAGETTVEVALTANQDCLTIVG